jgi:molecular chaperone GrpE
LESFGSPGDPFDPIVHEAVMHSTSAEVSQPTAVQVMRRGYRHGERLIRPAMVAVAEPEHGAPAEEAPSAGWTAPGAEPQSDPDQQ